MPGGGFCSKNDERGITMKHEITPGAWEVDAQGRRFRRIGVGCIEYEKTIRIDGLEVPESELDDFHRMRQAPKRTEPPKISRTCPFSMGLGDSCKPGCAFYTDEGCAMTGHATDTGGKRCPFNNRTCRPECGLYKGGCTITKEREKL